MVGICEAHEIGSSGSDCGSSSSDGEENGGAFGSPIEATIRNVLLFIKVFYFRILSTRFQNFLNASRFHCCLFSNNLKCNN